MTDTVMSNTYNEEFVDLKFVGKNKQNFVYTPLPVANWTFTPSGRFGAYYRTYSTKLYNGWMFTFIDLVDKVCFEIPLKYKKKKDDDDEGLLHTFYFTADDEMIVLSDFSKYIKQRVYKIDYNKRKLILQEEISHEFTVRDEEEVQFKPGMFTYQHANFVTCERIDYVVLVCYGEYLEDLQLNIYTIYMVPKEPINRNLPMKEFQMHLKVAVRFDFEDKVNDQFPHQIVLALDESSCMINGTKLMFSCKLESSEEDVESSPIGTLVGAFYEAELAAFKDIFNISDIEECKRLVKDQGDIGDFVQQGDLYISDYTYLMCYIKDVGMINIIDNNFQKCKNCLESLALHYPQNMVDDAQPISLNCKLGTEDGEHRYSVHPHGALLHLSFVEGNFIRLRVLKCLKSNLESLAFNRALFHKDTPIKNHLVYRLFFKNTFKYNNVSQKKALKRKAPTA